MHLPVSHNSIGAADGKSAARRKQFITVVIMSVVWLSGPDSIIRSNSWTSRCSHSLSRWLHWWWIGSGTLGNHLICLRQSVLNIFDVRKTIYAYMCPRLCRWPDLRQRESAAFRRQAASLKFLHFRLGLSGINAQQWVWPRRMTVLISTCCISFTDSPFTLPNSLEGSPFLYVLSNSDTKSIGLSETETIWRPRVNSPLCRKYVTSPYNQPKPFLSFIS